MAITKQMNIKSRTYYLYNDLINIPDFDKRLLKLDKKKHQRVYWLYYKKTAVEC